MKNKLKILSILLLCSTLMIYSCSYYPQKRVTPKQSIEKQKKVVPETSDKPKGEDETKSIQYSVKNTSDLQLNKIRKNPKAITDSGPVTVLPWENEQDFLKAQIDNDTPVLMAAYRAMLKDPLPGEEYNVHLAARLLAGKVILSGKIFSQNGQIGPYSKKQGFREGPTYVGPNVRTTIGGGVCKIASTLYNVVILSNLQVIERYNHSMPVPYVPYGQDATVSYGTRDFKFKNNTSYPIMIWAKGIGSTLYIAFYGSKKPPKIEWYHEFLKIEKAPTIYRKNSKLPPGEQKLVMEGMDGATVKSWITIEQLDGTTIKKDLGISYYRPMPHITEKND